MDRRARILVTAGVVCALVAPVVLDRDSLPLSTYPMYSRARGAEVTLPTAQAVDGTGRPSPLTLEVIGGSDDPLIVAGELRTAIRNDAADRRCVEIATRAATWSDLPVTAVGIEVVTERHDVVARAGGQPSLLERTVYASCEVPGR
jgi:hypothetical protein